MGSRHLVPKTMKQSLIRAVFDANILLQAFLNPIGPSGRCFQMARERKIQLFISKYLIAEIADVMRRPHLCLILPENAEVQIDRFFAELQSNSYQAKQKAVVFKLDRDPKDEKIIELVASCDADFLVTRDNDMLDLMTNFDLTSKEFRQRFRGLKVVDPKDFLVVINKKDSSLRP